jgi:hypothetical protein
VEPYSDNILKTTEQNLTTMMVSSHHIDDNNEDPYLKMKIEEDMIEAFFFFELHHIIVERRVRINNLQLHVPLIEAIVDEIYAVHACTPRLLLNGQVIRIKN